MPVFEADAPQTVAQRRRRWIIATLIAATGVGFGIWSALDCARIPFGYIASYSFAIVFMIGCLSVFSGLSLMIYWRTRSTGVALLSTGIAMYLIFSGCINILKKFDRVAWVHEPPAQTFGLDQPASLVIYYNHGTTEQQIQDFVEHRLEGYPSKVHDGTDLPDFVTEYVDLIPSQANGFDGSALKFKPGSHGAAVDSFVAMVQSDSRVARVFRDTSPNAIHLPESLDPTRQMR